MSGEIALITKDITDTVSKKIGELEESGLKLPSNYNYQNALKSAFFAISKVKTGRDSGYKPALEVCNKSSIANSLLNMVTQGLNPAKNQCYFIVYGKELQLQRSYFGTVSVLKRLDEIKDIYAEVIHEDDTFQIGSDGIGRRIIKKFEPKFENLDKDIIGAFAVIVKNDDDVIYTIMTKKEIDTSWSKTKAHANAVQKEFSQEMAKRTVLNRAAKMYVNTSDDADLLSESINQSTENEYTDRKIVKDEKSESLAEKLAQSANKQLEESTDEKGVTKDAEFVEVDK